ncbi:MAG: polysaccharide deacetylase family protein [Syntrophomonadaceae bacterium]|jgi:probable sporulation protein (polysaccharide deacetylase family)
MKIYYFPRKALITIGVLALFITAASGIMVTRNSNGTVMTSNMADPIYQGNTGQKVVALTVNVDWGEEFIPAMLEQFKKHKVRVTFFVTGVWAQRNPELLKQMYAEGHSIQNHGYKHINFNSLSAAEASREIKKAEKIIYDIIGYKTTFFAPPSGEFNKEVARGIGDINYKLVMWSVDTVDWKRPSPYIIVNRVMNKVHNDAIILMHPTDPTVKALPDMLAKLTQEEYKMVTIDKILVSASGKKNEDSRER